jgi:hypothetical protein
MTNEFGRTRAGHAPVIPTLVYQLAGSTLFQIGSTWGGGTPNFRSIIYHLTGSWFARHQCISAREANSVRLSQRLFLLLLGTAVLGISCIPAARGSHQTLRRSRRSQQSVARRSRHAMRLQGRTIGAHVHLLPKKGVSPPPSLDGNDDSHATVSILAVLPPLRPGSSTWLLGGPSQEYASPSRYLFFCRFLI